MNAALGYRVIQSTGGDPMAIPDYQTVMLPLLVYARDKKEHSLKDAVKAIAEEFKLTDEEVQVLLPSGQQYVLSNRVGWARTYMTKAGLLQSPKRGVFSITDLGLKVLAEKPKKIDVPFLMRFKEFEEFRALRHEKGSAESENDESTTSTPEETLDLAYQRIRADLETDVLTKAKACSPQFFERVVVETLVKMGYGGTLRDAGKAIGRSGDGGIDGIINEDRLGLDIIYIQAKRWENPVGRPEIQKFAGALQGFRARKGVFITTSSFSKDALEYAARIESKIILIDGTALASLMVDYNVGVAPSRTYDIKRIDSDYFEE